MQQEIDKRNEVKLAAGRQREGGGGAEGEGGGVRGQRERNFIFKLAYNLLEHPRPILSKKKSIEKKEREN